MNGIIPSAQFPIMMRPKGMSGFMHPVSIETILKLDAKCSKKEVKKDKAEISKIELLAISNDTFFGEVLMDIERVHAEPASMTQLIDAGLIDRANKLGLHVRALRHSVTIDDKEYNLCFAPKDGFGLDNVDEAVPLKAGSVIGFIRQKPIGTIAAA